MSIVLTNKQDDGLVQIILNRPEKRNAFNADTIRLLQKTLEQLEHDDSVRLIELTGEGNHFCAGADLTWMQETANYSYDENLADAQALSKLMNTLQTINKPTLATVRGACFGGAVGLVACCDFAIAAESALFCLSEVKLGLIPAVISPYVLSAMGRRQAVRYMSTAEVMSAVLAFELGLVHEVAPDAEFAQQRADFIGMLMQNGPKALQVLKGLVVEIADQPIDMDVQRLTAEAIARIRSSDEGQEGIAAFLEKRPPAWNQ